MERQRERERISEEGGKKGGWGGRERHACTPGCTGTDLPAPSLQPPLHLAASRPLCTSAPPPLFPQPIHPLPFCLVPLHWAATARLAQRVGAECAGEHVCMCVNISLCVCVGKAWVLVACRSVLQCFLTFFFSSSFSHMALNNQVLPKDCT